MNKTINKIVGFLKLDGKDFKDKIYIEASSFI
jgi:hypothetical protein